MMQDNRPQETPTAAQPSDELTAVALALIVGGSTDPDEPPPGKPKRRS